MAEKKENFSWNTEFNPQILREVIRRHWWTPIIWLTILNTAAFFYLRYTKPIYRSHAKIQIIEENKVNDLLGKETNFKENNVLLRNRIVKIRCSF